MKKLLYLITILPGFLCAAGPIFQHDEPPIQREFQEVYSELKDLQNSISSTSASIVTTIPAGSKVIFFQASCPSGWTQDTSNNGYVLRGVSGTGGGTAGTTDPNATVTLAHTHTVNAHTHTISHRHVSPMRVDTGAGGTIGTPSSSADWPEGFASISTNVRGVGTGGSVGGTFDFYKTKDSDTANSGSTSPGTDSQLSNLTYKTMNVIVCTKN